MIIFLGDVELVDVDFTPVNPRGSNEDPDCVHLSFKTVAGVNLIFRLPVAQAALLVKATEEMVRALDGR